MVKPKRFVSIKETRERMGGMPQSTLYQKIKEGKFPKPFKVGRRNVFDEDELAEFQAAQIAKRDAGRPA